ncbi:GGDEF domain-containing protein [Meiothermus taiwanensis]|uniref:GGDEF domain-containing protein n=1 Tax=Meiothermus taiwanensis TaxID=172827 RepID=UPI0011C3DF36|nr:GGDEF domain-containing protein [Meiothermus taiwanensis]
MIGVHPEVGLLLLAVASGLALWWPARTEPVWRWASLGTLLWGMQAAVWLLERQGGLEASLTPSGVLLFAAALTWAATLRQLRLYEPPRLSLALLPFVLAALVTALSGLPDRSSQMVWLTDLLPVLLALPLLEAALHGQAGESRLVWGLGLIFKAGGSWALALGWPPSGFVYLVWALGFVLIGWGGYLEATETRLGKGLLGFVLGSLLGSLVLLGWPSQVVHPLHSAVLVGWGYVALVALGGVGWGVYQRIIKAERQLELWINLLESLSTKTQSTQNLTPQGVLHSVMDGLRPLYGNLAGIEVRSDVTIRAGQSGPYVYTFELALDTPTEGRLYFSSAPKDTRRLEALAPLLTERLRLSLTLNEWRSKAYTDPLTGLLNRRGFERQLQRLIRLAGERNKPITLALLDLDRFKQVNDTYGHPVGDKLLKQLAEVLHKASRSDDLAVRLGGEEFALVLFGADLEDAYRVLERIQSEVRALQISPIAWRLSISAGLAGGEIPPSMATVQRWLEQADRALYKAKQAGRDRIHPALISSRLAED